MKKSTNLKKSLLLLGLTISSACFAKETIVCQSKTLDEMMLYLDTGKLKGKTISCISGDLWAVDGNSCSANGYYALHANSGILFSFVKSWQDASDGDTLTYFWKNEAGILFSASGVLAGGDGVEFYLNRHTGKAVFKNHVLNQKVDFFCSKIKKNKV
ncbi:hypothetical protein [Hydromonas duriensis]|uniref:Uncharacterized protein n=1 Tax=Hydromonas duriensis TaxID=1527608 RepID=A0A4R6YAJ8_9BURK|nr:hypothetical protein [Hydromonas duriensis]TDR32511.1 hypothetical protein DFR44_10324 [Hydromonas duriensis]